MPLEQVNGCVSTPVAAVGDRVREGALIGRREGEGSVNIHSPIPGKIIQDVSWDISRTVRCSGFAIRLEGEFDKLGKKMKERDWRQFSSAELQKIGIDYGIVEMDGSGIPLADTIAGVNGPASLVVRCVFDDPWLVADYVLCKERLNDIAEGAFIAAKMIQAEKIVLAVSAPERKLGEELLQAIHEYAASSGETGAAPVLVLVGGRYPQRHRREMEIALRHFEKREKTPLNALVHMGLATVCAIYDAVKYQKPVLDRYVAVGGSALVHPRVLKVRIGSRIRQVFEECGGFNSVPKRIAVGSPLLGRSVVSLDEPISPYTYAVFAVANEKPGLSSNPRVLDLRGKRSRLPLNNDNKRVSTFTLSKYMSSSTCISCGECRSVCPVGLDPEKLYKKFSQNAATAQTRTLARKCYGCGCCGTVCPSSLPLSQLIVSSVSPELAGPTEPPIDKKTETECEGAEKT
jgi:electron transport complex protein RnfC